MVKSLLKNKYKTKPVHSVDEIKFLIKNNSNNIESFFAIYNNQVIGGLIMYCSSKTYHIQYIAANDEGKKLFSPRILHILGKLCLKLQMAQRSQICGQGMKQIVIHPCFQILLMELYLSILPAANSSSPTTLL
jgi:hypothetical protein